MLARISSLTIIMLKLPTKPYDEKEYMYFTWPVLKQWHVPGVTHT